MVTLRPWARNLLVSTTIATAGVTGIGVLAAAPAGATTLSAERAAKAKAEVRLEKKAVKLASKEKGKPYVWGADGPNGFDCSGLVKYVYGHLGKQLPHNALGQYRMTRHIRRSQLRPGDLIFMSLGGGGTGAIDHVGIYSGHGHWWVARSVGTRITNQKIWTNQYWVGRVK